MVARLDALNPEIIGYEGRAGAVARAPASREKDRVALDAEMRTAGGRSRAHQFALSVARLELERCVATPEERGAARTESRRRRREERLRAEAEARLEGERGELEKLEDRPRPSPKSTRRFAAELAGFENGIRRAPCHGAWSRSSARSRIGKRIAQEIESLGEVRRAPAGGQHRTGSEAALLASRSLRSEAQSMRWRRRKLPCARRCGQRDEDLKQLPPPSRRRTQKRTQTEVDLVRKQAELKYWMRPAARS